MTTLRVVRKAATLRVTIDRPTANNAINAELTRELLQTLRRAGDDDAIRVLVLEGSPTVFCTGLDFEEFSQAASDANVDADAALYYDLLRTMAHSPKVIVALVDGSVNAGGVGLVAAADLVIAGPGATFALSELLFGLLPACALPFLMRRVGFHKAQQLALTTQPIGVQEAHRWGLVDECADDPEQALRRRLPRMARVTPEATRRLKVYMNELQPIPAETRELAVTTIAGLLRQPATQAAISRFVRDGVFPWQA